MTILYQKVKLRCLSCNNIVGIGCLDPIACHSKNETMEEVFICYKTDTHHSYASRDLIGVGTTLDYAIHLCQLQADKEGDEIDSEQLFNLHNIKQTQGYSGEGEFQIEEVQTDKLL